MKIHTAITAALLISPATLLAAQGPTAARAALALPIPEVNVDNGTFGRVIDYLRTTSGANIVVDWKILEAVGVSKDTPVTLNVRSLSLRKMLQLTLNQAAPSTPLAFTVDQNVIEITTQDDADTHLITRVYDVNELVMPLKDDVQPPKLDIQQSTQQTSSGGGEGSSIFGGSGSSQQSTDTAQKRGEDLVKTIETVVRPNIWRDNGGTASIQYLMGQLIVTAPISVHEAIAGPVHPDAADRYGM